MAKPKNNTALTWIIKEAKRLRSKDGHRKEWKNYVKQASAIYAQKNKSKSPVGKPKKKLSKASVTGVRKKRTARKQKRKPSIGTVSQHISIAKKSLEDQLAAKMLRQYKATKKTDKRKLGKDISELKSKIKKLSS